MANQNTMTKSKAAPAIKLSAIPIYPGRLRHFRKAKGLKQYEAAKLAGLRTGLLTLYETGQAKPTYEHILSLAAIYSVSPSEFLTPESETYISGVIARLANL